MIITRLYLDNLYGFSDTEIDFSYRRKNLRSNITDEFLPKRPKFNFKRVCIISGTNAGGKTSLGRVICGVENFLSSKALTNYLTLAVCDKEQPAKVLAEFVTPADNTLHLLELSFQYAETTPESLKYSAIPIGLNDSCPAARKKLLGVHGGRLSKSSVRIDSTKAGLVKALDDFSDLTFSDLSWMFMFSENKNEDKDSKSGKHISSNLMFSVLKCFDNSIESVEAVVPRSEAKKKSEKSATPSGYILKFQNGDSVLIDAAGEIAGGAGMANRFSKGTYDAIKLTDFIGRVIDAGRRRESCTHYLDEQMAYSHSQLEQHILNLIIEKLSPTAQFFYTTHNYDILDMGLPPHTFLFMRKDGGHTEVVQPENTFSKNDRVLTNYVKNNYFDTLPDTSPLDKLMWAD